MLNNRVVKADVRKVGVNFFQSFVRGRAKNFFCLVENVTELERKNSAIPQRARSDKFFRVDEIRLLFERDNFADNFGRSRNDVTIFFAWISRLNSHKYKRRVVNLRGERGELRKKIIVNIRIDGTNYNRFVQVDALNVVQISRRQSY